MVCLLLFGVQPAFVQKIGTTTVSQTDVADGMVAIGPMRDNEINPGGAEKRGRGGEGTSMPRRTHSTPGSRSCCSPFATRFKFEFKLRPLRIFDGYDPFIATIDVDTILAHVRRVLQFGVVADPHSSSKPNPSMIIEGYALPRASEAAAGRTVEDGIFDASFVEAVCGDYLELSPADRAF